MSVEVDSNMSGEEREVVCEKCNWINCPVNDDMKFCSSCEWSIVKVVCDFCGYDDKAVKKDDVGFDVCENCWSECQFCGEERGCEFIQDSDITVCRQCFEDDGRFCDGCDGFYHYEDLIYMGDYGDNCEDCSEWTIKANDLVRCEECGEYDKRVECCEREDKYGDVVWYCEVCVGDGADDEKGEGD